MENKIEICNIAELSEKEHQQIDNFILSPTTNGEFINSLKFISYHPVGSFFEDSIIVRDTSSKTIRGVMLAAIDKNNNEKIISHSGTTFAGPIIDRKLSVEDIDKVLNYMLGYYENKYKEIVIKTQPEYYTEQPFNTIPYFLLKRGYVFGITALANIINISNINSEEDVLLLFDAKKRNQTKKALKNLFVFESCEEIRQDVWTVMNDNLSTKFHSKSTHTYIEIVDLLKRFPGLITAHYVDTKNGDYGAFSVSFQFKNVFHTQYLDTNYKYSGQYPNLFLIFQMILVARRLGYKYFSFGASTDNNGEYLNTGLYNYKAGYGGGDIILPVYKWKRD